MSSIMLTDIVESLKFIHGTSENPWEACCEILAGCDQLEEFGLGTIAPFSTLLSGGTEEVLRLTSANAGIGAGVFESSKVDPADYVGAYPETALHRDAYWFERLPSDSYEAYDFQAILADNRKSAVSQLLAQRADICSDTDSAEALSLGYHSSSVDLECDRVNIDDPDMLLEAEGADLGLLAGCEPNVIRSPDDMYTPRWMRGIGKSKEGLCPVCFSAGKQNWKRMKCSAYWYHLNYFHGVSSLTGRPFPNPQATRMVPAGSGRQRQQGQCHICYEWVDMESSRKARVNVPEIYWWKHIQACIKRTWDE
ncbi:hypothetical protein IWW39_000980 [Coemansia spiralis]|uniref:Transcription regulator Rua1 C-terminal domain-containing protein n=1 Tax=Coemansia spiralis TaxID=417178 RepID=A0A9W8GP29_9FUNG|nr:hypothetical protein IWW39_000980 [Coemansia spiralis]